MPATITVRDVPDAVRDELAARAARAGQSLQEYLRQVYVDIASRPFPDDVLARARARVALTGTVLSAEQILADLNAGGRQPLSPSDAHLTSKETR